MVTKLIDKLKETVKKLTPNGKAAKLLQEDIDTYEEAKDLWYRGIESIMEKNAKEDVKKEDVQNDNDTNRFSMKEKDNIFQKDTLSKSEWAMFYSKIGERKNRYYFPKAADGNYIMTINNKLVYTNGNWESPRIDRVIEIDVDGVSGIERSTYISYIQEELIEYEKNGQEVSGDVIDDIEEFDQNVCRGKINIKEYIQKNHASGKGQRATDTIPIHGESGGAVKEQSNRRRDKRIHESERSGDLKEKFSLKEPVEETKEGNEKDSSQAAVNKLDGVRFSTKDLNNPEYYTYDNLISLPDMQIENSKMDIVSKEKTRTDIVNKAMENIEISKYGRRDGNKCFIENKYLGDIMITKGSIRHTLTKTNENRVIAALNIAKYLPESIVINQADGKRNKADKSYVLLGVMMDGTNQYILRTTLNAYNNGYEVAESKVLYAVAPKKSQLVSFNQGLGNKSVPHTDSYRLSVKDLLDVVKNYFPNELPMDVLNYIGLQRGDGSIEGLRYSLKNEEGSSLYASKEDDFAWMEDILKEEPDIKETASILQEGTEALRKAKKAPDAAEVRKISRSILEDIGSQYDLDTFSDNLEKVFSYMQSEDNVSYDDMVRVMTEVAWHEFVVARREKDPVDIAYREKKK